MNRTTALVIAMFLAVAAGCSEPRCPPTYVQDGNICRRCPGGTEAVEGRCVDEAGVAVDRSADGGGSDLEGEGDESEDATVSAGRDTQPMSSSPDASSDAEVRTIADSASGIDGTAQSDAASADAGMSGGCRQDNECEGGSHCLVSTGQCVACLDARHCAGQPTASVCNPSTHACESCHDGVDSDCRQVPAANVCHAGVCVQCSGSRRDACAEDKPSCNASDRCDVCRTHSDCARFNKVCDATSQRCVACTLDTESARCNGASCNPATLTCTQTSRGSVNFCGKCVADSECVAGYRCIELSYAGALRGGYCLKLATPMEAECESAARVGLAGRRSLSGAPTATYCGINERLTTCEAILRSGAVCSGRTADRECAPAGAVCRDFGGSYACTYPCATNFDCSVNFACPASGTDKYCGLP